MTVDHEKLKQDESDKSAKLQELMSVVNSKHKHKILNANNTNNKNTSITNNSNKKSNKITPFYDSNNFYLSPPLSSDYICQCGSVDNIYDQYAGNETTCKDIDADYDENDLDAISRKIKISKLRKELLNSNKQNQLYNTKTNSGKSKSLISTILSTIPLALPTLQLHILLSLTMVLLTHRCPQYLIIL